MKVDVNITFTQYKKIVKKIKKIKKIKEDLLKIKILSWMRLNVAEITISNFK